MPTPPEDRPDAPDAWVPAGIQEDDSGAAPAPKRPGKTAPAKRKPPAVPGDGGGLDLNEVSFEGLRALGLSVNQAARFIGQREQRGGFRSPDDIESVIGLPADLKQELKRQGSR